jgi:hypothetical protein
MERFGVILLVVGWLPGLLKGLKVTKGGTRRHMRTSNCTRHPVGKWPLGFWKVHHPSKEQAQLTTTELQTWLDGSSVYTHSATQKYCIHT